MIVRIVVLDFKQYASNIAISPTLFHIYVCENKRIYRVLRYIDEFDGYFLIYITL